MAKSTQAWNQSLQLPKRNRGEFPSSMDRTVWQSFILQSRPWPLFWTFPNLSSRSSLRPGCTSLKTLASENRDMASLPVTSHTTQRNEFLIDFLSVSQHVVLNDLTADVKNAEELDLEETAVVAPLKNQYYKVQIGSESHHVQKHWRSASWILGLDDIWFKRAFLVIWSNRNGFKHNMDLISPSNTSVHVISYATLFKQVGDRHVLVHYGVVQNPAILLLVGSLNSHICRGNISYGLTHCLHLISTIPTHFIIHATIRAFCCFTGKSRR